MNDSLTERDSSRAAQPPAVDAVDPLTATLALALDVGRVGAWECDLRSDVVRWRGAMERLHGLPSGSFGGTLAAFSDAIHPDDRQAAIAAIRGGAFAEEPKSIEYRAAHADGTRFIEARVRRVSDAMLVGVCFDASERHRPDRDLLETVADGFSMIDRSWRISYVNEAGAQFLGLSPDELIGRDLWSVAAGLAGTPLAERYRQAMDGGEPFAIDAFYYEPLAKWFASRVYPTAAGLVVHSQDVTERKRRESLQAAHVGLRNDLSAALASTQPLDETLRACCEAAVKNLGVAFARIWLHDVPARMLELRASAGLYTHTDGGHARVPVGKFKIGLIADENKPHLTNDVQHDPRVGNPEWARREGMVSFAGYPLVADGAVLGVFAMFGRAPLAAETLELLGSVSDAVAQGIKRRQAEAALEDRARELQRSNNDLEQFAYVASHDLQEPLRMVTNYLQLIERRYKEHLDAAGHEFIGFAVEGATRMQRLINDLLSYSRVGRRGAAFTEVALDDVLVAALADVSATIEETGATVTADPLPRVGADATQMSQLLQNLVGNALKFHGREPPRVHVGAERRGRDWHLWVRDNGIGIEPQYFERIFVIFQRLHGRHEYPGTGIGLAICKKIVERHGGRIWLESQPGQGATFHFTLPAQERTT